MKKYISIACLFIVSAIMFTSLGAILHKPILGIPLYRQLFDISDYSDHIDEHFDKIEDNTDKVIELNTKVSELEKVLAVKEASLETLESQLEMLKEGRMNNGEGQATTISDFEFGLPVYYETAYGRKLDVPAFGPVMTLHPSGINHTQGMQVLFEEDAYFTRVVVEGLVPTWYLEDKNTANQEGEYRGLYYVVDPGELKLTPEDQSLTLFELRRGSIGEVVDEWNHWVYIKMKRSPGAETLTEGWVKRGSLGKYEALEGDGNIGIDVRVKLAYFPDYIDTRYRKALWGTIYEESETHYGIAIGGGDAIEVPHEGIYSFIGTPE